MPLTETQKETNSKPLGLGGKKGMGGSRKRRVKKNVLGVKKMMVPFCGGGGLRNRRNAEASLGVQPTPNWTLNSLLRTAHWPWRWGVLGDVFKGRILAPLL